MSTPVTDGIGAVRETQIVAVVEDGKAVLTNDPVHRHASTVPSSTSSHKPELTKEPVVEKQPEHVNAPPQLSASERRAAMVAKARSKGSTAIVTERIPPSQRVAKAKQQAKHLAISKAREQAEAKRKEAAEERAREEANQRAVDQVREVLGYQTVDLREVEACIPPMFLKYLPDDYYKMGSEEKYEECKKVLAFLPPMPVEANENGANEKVKEKNEAEEADERNEETEEEEKAEEKAAEMAGDNGAVLEERIYKTTSSDPLTILSKAENGAVVEGAQSAVPALEPPTKASLLVEPACKTMSPEPT